MKNPVAKYAALFNRASVQRNKKKDYQRQLKHRGKWDATS